VPAPPAQPEELDWQRKIRVMNESIAARKTAIRYSGSVREDERNGG